jgi:peptidyl-dipeptidase A
MLHELGHGVYDKYIQRDLPFLLREASHGITTEGIALMFGSMVKNQDWLLNVLHVDPTETERVVLAARAALRREKIVFSRWAQVMVRFEHAMYAKPEQDLGKLWWELKRRYQFLNPPEATNRPDYAAKMHILSSPVYYHNYLMGDLFAAQVHHFIATNLLGLNDPKETSFYERRVAGAYLREKVFSPGNRYPWNELTRHATGETLTARYFVEQFLELRESNGSEPGVQATV